MAKIITSRIQYMKQCRLFGIDQSHKKITHDLPRRQQIENIKFMLFSQSKIVIIGIACGCGCCTQTTEQKQILLLFMLLVRLLLLLPTIETLLQQRMNAKGWIEWHGLYISFIHRFLFLGCKTYRGMAQGTTTKTTKTMTILKSSVIRLFVFQLITPRTCTAICGNHNQSMTLRNWNKLFGLSLSG